MACICTPSRPSTLDSVPRPPGPRAPGLRPVPPPPRRTQVLTCSPPPPLSAARRVVARGADRAASQPAEASSQAGRPAAASQLSAQLFSRLQLTSRLASGRTCCARSRFLPTTARAPRVKYPPVLGPGFELTWWYLALTACGGDCVKCKLLCSIRRVIGDTWSPVK